VAVFRALLLLFAIAVTASAVAYLYTGNRKYLRWAGRLLMAGLAAGLLFFVGLTIERLL
jgi:1,4-dihydroxy-2-naphthoate octaprenyltransferase